MILPHPAAQLAGCCWLPRLAAKTRAHLTDGLPWAYRIAFGSRIGMDGFFFRHFRLNRPQIIAAIRTTADDDSLARWFLAQPGVTPATIAAWNQLAPQLGAKGQPGYRIRQLVKWFLYPKSIRRPVPSLFAAIVQDEELV